MISVKGLHKTFTFGKARTAALQGIDLEVREGEFFVLLGPSGSGKTTLLRSVAGLEKPDRGEILLGGKTLFSSAQKIHLLPEERGIGMVFQSYAIWPHLSVADNIGLVITHGKMRLPRDKIKGRIRRALSLVQLEEFEQSPARLLSGGQQQRVALARALAVNPKVLLMDEPLSNLDARLREEVRSKIRSLVSGLKITSLYVTHDQVEAMVLADRIAVMAGGRVLEVAPTYEPTARASLRSMAGPWKPGAWFWGLDPRISGSGLRPLPVRINLPEKLSPKPLPATRSFLNSRSKAGRFMPRPWSMGWRREPGSPCMFRKRG